ncbi:MAG: alpha-hydroxy-acid oxidizing protein, partial [Stellaceae bacterium]
HGGGTPMLQNWQPYAPNGANAEAVYNFSRSLMPFNAQTWRDLETYRRLFPRALVVKGVMNPADALRAAEIGCDGIIVSNHGGRQLDQAPASLDVLPAIKEAVGDKLTVMLDSGVRRGADLMLAQAATEANIPYIMSGASNDSIEAAAKIAPRNAWYQLYAANDAKVREDMIRRTADAGLDALVLTVDVPASSKRERNIRNGFANVRGGLFQALSLKPSILLESLAHPGWIVEYLRHGGGTPMLQNWQPYAANGATAEAVYNYSRSIMPYNAQTWRDLEQYRRLFPRNLVVKGIMDPRDALRAAEIGCDGIIVSNHGGRQLDQAPASLDVLPAIDEAVGDKLTVMLDSGVRRGADILIALCLGARFCFMGRPTLYGAAAGGIPGVKKAIDIFRTEIDLVMGQIGCPSLDQLGPDFLWREDRGRNV